MGLPLRMAFILPLIILCGKAWCGYPSEPTFTLAGIPCPFAMEAGDLNHDGAPDLIVSSWLRSPVSGEQYDKAKNRVCLFYQKKGSFAQPPDRIIALESPWALKVADIDGDGLNDLTVADLSQRLHLYLGKENLEVDHAVSNANQYERSLTVGKISAPGLMDFLVGPVWRKWSGDTSFEQGYFYAPPNNDNKTPSLGDLNHDGFVDAVFATRENLIRIYYGPFLSTEVYPADAARFVQLRTPFPISQIEVADFNGDGRPDIAASAGWQEDAEKRKALLYLQNAPVGFTEGGNPSHTIAGAAGLLAVADVNRDGLSDLIVAENAWSHSRIYVFCQPKGKPFAGSVNEADQVLDLHDANSACCLKVADLNGDGYPDLLTSSSHGADPGVVRGFLGRA